MAGDELRAIPAEHVAGENVGVDRRRFGVDARLEQPLAAERDGFVECQWVASSPWESLSFCDCSCATA
jgi:hypothetical protein